MSLYDPVVALTMRERTFRSRLVAQVAAGEPTAVLEIGCGTGSLTRRLARALPTASITGIDPDGNALARAHVKLATNRVDLRAGVLDGFERTGAHARGELPALVEDAGFRDVECRDRLRTGWGTLELLSAARREPVV
jgi:ribosomal protein L11 methylase PrmA